MLEPGMGGPRIDKVCQSQLFYSSKSLEIRMFNYIKQTFEGDLDKSVDRIIDDFFLVGADWAHWR